MGTKRKRLRDVQTLPVTVVVCQLVLTRHEVLQLVEVLGEEKVDVAKGSDEERAVFIDRVEGGCGNSHE